MPLEGDTFYRNRADILAEMLAELQVAIPDFYVGEDGTLTIIFTIESGQLENVYLANQILANDLFPQTASLVALQQYGVQYNLPMHTGNRSTGTLRFEGAGGTYIPIGAEVGYDPGGGLDVVFFETLQDGTIPNPGDPATPTVAVNAVAGNLNGTYEYVVTFVNASGETLPSAPSASVNPVSQKVDVTAIPVGGAGTTQRKIYRDKNGAGTYRLVATINDNTTLTYTDNITDATVAGGSLAPTVDTAHRITLNGEAQNPGLEGNAAIGTITELTDAPAELISVINPTAFIGGTDQEDIEDFRARIMERLQNPQTGSPGDLIQWATQVEGVESATVFPNLNGTVAAPGEVTIRISAIGGAIPSAGLIAAVQAAIDLRGLAQVKYHVMGFTAVVTNVTVDVTTSGTYSLADVTAPVQAAITSYINSLEVGETFKIAGVIDAVFGLAGVGDVTVTTPSSNQTTAADSKRTPGTITVT